MKCPNCGAEVNGKFCAYCGSAIEQEVEEINELNCYKECPRCGSKNIKFRREQVKNSKRANGKYDSASGYKTVGFCEECGYTWDPLKYPKKKINGKTILWILGWLCIFPVPLTILLLRSDKIKSNVAKYVVIAMAWIAYLIIGIGGNSNKKAEPISDPIPTVIATIAPTAEPTPKITTELTIEPTATPESEVEEKLTIYDELSNHIDNFVENTPYDFTYIKMDTSEDDPNVECATVMKAYDVNGDTIAVSATYDNNKNVIYWLVAPSVPTNDLGKYLKLLAPMLDPSLKGLDPDSIGFSNKTVDADAMTVSYNYGKNLMVSVRILDATYIDVSVMGYWQNE